MIEFCVGAHIVEWQHGDRRFIRRGHRSGLRGCIDRRRATRQPPPHFDRSVDVFDLPVAQVLEREIDAVANLVVDSAGYADAARLGQALQPRRQIDAIALNVIAVDHHIAEVDAEAEHDSAVFRQLGIALDNCPLHVGGHPNRAGDAVELGQHPVAHQLDDAPLVLGDLGIDELQSNGFQGRERTFLVRSDEARIAHDIGGQYGSETAFHGILLPARLYRRYGRSSTAAAGR